MTQVCHQGDFDVICLRRQHALKIEVGRSQSQGGYAQHRIFYASRDQQGGQVGTWTFCKHLKVLFCLFGDLSCMPVAFNLIAALCMFYIFSAAPPTTYLLW